MPASTAMKIPGPLEMSLATKVSRPRSAGPTAPGSPFPWSSTTRRARSTRHRRWRRYERARRRCRQVPRTSAISRSSRTTSTAAAPAIWRLLDIFDELDVQCTFFACAVALERNPRGRRGDRAGPRAVPHGWRWEEYARSTGRRNASTSGGRSISLDATTGARPARLVLPLWAEREHARAARRGGWLPLRLATPTTTTCPTSRWSTARSTWWSPTRWPTTTPSSTAGPSVRPSHFENHLKAAFDWLYKEGRTHPKMMSIGLHMRIAGHPGRAQALANFIAYAKSFPGVWFTRRIDIANHWITHHQDTLLPRRTYPRLVPDAR